MTPFSSLIEDLMGLKEGQPLFSSPLKGLDVMDESSHLSK